MILGPHIDRVTFRNPDNTIFEIHTVAIGSDAKKYAQQWIERNRRPGPSTWSYSIERNGEQTGATMANRTTVELKKANIAAMGEGLGAIFSELWQSFAVAHLFWNEYVILFGTKPERIQHLNRSAPGFFRMLQDEFWESALLHLARLTDPTNSQGKQGKANLTIRALPGLITDATLKDSVNKLLAGALKQTEFCRDWRNRHIAHRDLRLALEQPTTGLHPVPKTPS